MDNNHSKYLRAAFTIANNARSQGNHPFGAVLVDEHGQILLEAGNTTVTSGDATGHAELNLVREASMRFDREFLSRCAIYTSTEPCPMCAGAIFWANIRTVIFGLSEKGLYQITGLKSEDVLDISCRDIFRQGRKPIEVIGPMLEDDAREVHKGFWN